MAASCISFVDWDNCVDFHSPSVSFCQTKEKKEEGEGGGGGRGKGFRTDW